MNNNLQIYKDSTEFDLERQKEAVCDKVPSELYKYIAQFHRKIIEHQTRMKDLLGMKDNTEEIIKQVQQFQLEIKGYVDYLMKVQQSYITRELRLITLKESIDALNGLTDSKATIFP